MGHDNLDYEGKTNKELSLQFENEMQNKFILNSLRWLKKAKNSLNIFRNNSRTNRNKTRRG